MGTLIDLKEYKEQREREEEEKIAEEIEDQIEYIKSILEIIGETMANSSFPPVDFTWEPYDFASLDLSGSLDGYE
jgi:hypothetical protein